MSTRAILETLDSGLSQTREYENKKDESATKVREYFIAKKAAEPGDAEVQYHFIQKLYSKTNLDTANLGQYTKNYLEEAFYELISLALFSRLKQNTAESNDHFAKANLIAGYLKNQFMIDHYNFAIVLDADPLKKKLKLERCYELVNQTLANDKDDGVGLIGAGLALAIEIGDEKRRLDLLSKCQYVLYELESLQHVGMSLGYYLLDNLSAYETLLNWTKFHMGNIWLDFKKPTEAREQFESALDWALDTGFAYAVMTLYERMALASMRLNKPNLAEKFYQESRNYAKPDQIRPDLIMKNEIRCLIGLGNICFRKAESQTGNEKENFCRTADQHFRQALELTNQVSYRTNKRVALTNLSELYKLWRGPNDPDAKHYLDLANQIN